MLKKILGALLVLVVLAAVFGDDKDEVADSGKSNSSSTDAPKQAKTDPLVENRPEQQKAFIAAVVDGQQAAKAAKNDMQKGGAKAKRDSTICAALSSLKVSDWTGTLETIDSNSDGKGVLTVKISKDVMVTTWNNAVSDFDDDTLLEPGTELFNKVSGFRKGIKVKFSGQFIRSDSDCIGEQSVTLDGKLEEPEFTFKFEDVSPL
jgi:hypothetical protein